MLEKRIKELYKAQYKKPEYSPRWYRLIRRCSPSREDVAFSIVAEFSGSILDVGCGEGKMLRRLSNKFDKLVGIDLIDYRINRGRQKNTKLHLTNIDLKVADIERGLKFKNESFDVVTCLGVLEYIFDPLFTLKEIYKILKHRGKFVLEVPNIAFIQQRILLLFGGLPNVAPAPGWQGGRLHNFNQTELCKLLDKVGFKVLSIKGSGFLCKIRNIKPSLLSGDLVFLCEKK